jgi:hypothetical protein
MRRRTIFYAALVMLLTAFGSVSNAEASGRCRRARCLKPTAALAATPLFAAGSHRAN